MTQIPRRQRPAHPPPVERHNAPVILFVTLTIKPRGNHLANETFHACFVRAGREADAWSIGRYLLMPDHVHLFCAPGMYPPVGIKRWIRYLKERTTKHLHGKAGIMNDDPAPHRVALHEMDQHCGGRGFAEPLPWRWLPDGWDTQMRSERHYAERWDYVRQNPVRAGWVQNPDDWPYQGELNLLRW